MDERRDHRLGIELHVGGVELIAPQNVDVDALPELSKPPYKSTALHWARANP
jgi:hypothetical protein